LLQSSNSGVASLARSLARLWALAFGEPAGRRSEAPPSFATSSCDEAIQLRLGEARRAKSGLSVRRILRFLFARVRRALDCFGSLAMTGAAMRFRELFSCQTARASDHQTHVMAPVLCPARCSPISSYVLSPKRVCGTPGAELHPQSRVQKKTHESNHYGRSLYPCAPHAMGFSAPPLLPHARACGRACCYCFRASSSRHQAI
jgi:hypothetical protein